MWKIFTKAGQDGWKALIPIYNLYILLQIVGLPSYYLLLALIPIVNLYVGIMVAINLAKSFGKSEGWGIGLLFILTVIGYPILGFGPDKYIGPGGSSARKA